MAKVFVGVGSDVPAPRNYAAVVVDNGQDQVRGAERSSLNYFFPVCEGNGERVKARVLTKLGVVAEDRHSLWRSPHA